MTDDLEIAKAEAQAWANLANRGGVIYVYRMRLNGSYYLTKASPAEINAEFVARVVPTPQ
jgi:hypothetical protein